MTTKKMIPVNVGRREEPPRETWFPALGSGLLGSWFAPFVEPWPTPLGAGLALDRLAPAFRLSERDDEVVVRAELPGVEAEDLKVQVEEGALSVSGEVRHASEERFDGAVRMERSVDRFQRTLALPAAVDVDKAAADFSDGVLTVTLPKASEPRAGRKRR